ncbi:uncharacterized protein V1510DRAFT_412332 [Dipodascopsis tothii]|uniref:uncharacterized protein n=1 Tax=Dipodascopsis tothii TaxID=44089 RepID=UPI0034CF9C43
MDSRQMKDHKPVTVSVHDLRDESTDEVQLSGKLVDNETRCRHWHSNLDVIAIRFKCCDIFFACYECHKEEQDHQVVVWSKEEIDSPRIRTILCGVCKYWMHTKEYFDCGSTCPYCKAGFNPYCSLHYDLYFEM